MTNYLVNETNKTLFNGHIPRYDDIIVKTTQNVNINVGAKDYGYVGIDTYKDYTLLCVTFERTSNSVVSLSSPIKVGTNWRTRIRNHHTSADTVAGTLNCYWLKTVNTVS